LDLKENDSNFNYAINHIEKEHDDLNGFNLVDGRLIGTQVVAGAIYKYELVYKNN